MNEKLWTVVARYCLGNTWLVPRKVSASDEDDAKQKAQKQFPTRWCGWKLVEIIVVPFSNTYTTIKVDKFLDEPLPKFKRPSIGIKLSPHHVSRGHRAKHRTGRTEG